MSGRQPAPIRDNAHPIVDAHHHLWDLAGPIRYPWLSHPEPNWLGNYSAIRRTYLPPEYRRDTALHDVVATGPCCTDPSSGVRDRRGGGGFPLT